VRFLVAQVEAAKEEAADSVRMTQEQVNELGSALAILSAKSSVLQERADLNALYQDNLATEKESEADPDPQAVALGKRIRNMIKKIDAQLGEYDAEVGAKMNTIAPREDGKLSVSDLAKALKEIRHQSVVLCEARPSLMHAQPG
jgi:LETM1 and EF-hand domain-containing protein 1